MKRIVLLSLLAASVSTAWAQNKPAEWNTPGAGNPFIPGYFADPTIRKFGDTYYIYATTDGTGNGYGPAQAWVSKDFVNWQNVLLNWPTTEVVWAPDVVQQPDGSFRYYYCTPCEVRVGESSSPLGPWKNRLGASDAVLVPDRFVPNAITLDPALFRDDDGAEYLYFGTWGIYKGFGCGVARLSEDGKSFTDKKLILNTEITDFFEAPFVFKRNGIYYFTYSSGSCHDDTYRVQYAVSTAGPMGPYTYKGSILKTNADGTIHGPGHHSILQEGDRYYIVYHRHNNPHAIHGFHRQICIDKMEFDSEGNILPIVPTHDGINFQKDTKEPVNLAFQAKVTASSTYNEWFRPEYAVDDNNGTLWRAASAGNDWRGKNAKEPAWLQIDLGKTMEFNEIFTQFEYATFFYQYKIETSTDGKTWKLFADRTDNHQQGSPMIDQCRVADGALATTKARYIRTTITDTQKNGHFPAVWNVKVYLANKQLDPAKLFPSPQTDEAAIVEGYPWIHKKDIELEERAAASKDNADGLLFELDANRYEFGANVQGVPVVPKDGKAAFRFDGKHSIHVGGRDDQGELKAPHMKMLTYNAPYTATAWVLNPEASGIETVAQFMPAGNDLATIELRNGTNPSEGIVGHNASFENAGAATAVKAGKWQHWVVSFDGFNERIYCDGQIVSEKNIFIMLRPQGGITIGASARGNNPFTGFLHALRLYDRAFSADEVAKDFARKTDFAVEKLNKVADQSPLPRNILKMNATLLSPQLLQVSVVTADGSPLPEGLCDYRFTMGDDTDFEAVAPVSENTAVLSIAKQEKGKATVRAQVSDVFGYTAPPVVISVNVNPKQFTDRADDIQAKATNGLLTLESEGTNLTAEPDDNGPIESVVVEGDFVLTCRVADMTGMDQHKTPAYNEGGLILQHFNDEGDQELVQLGVFPNYNCGNMLTLVRGPQRPQTPNNLGWNFDPWLMIRREGTNIQFMTSADGIHWTYMPGAAQYNVFGDIPLRAGIYQTTYSEAHASVTFADIHLWQGKK